MSFVSIGIKTSIPGTAPAATSGAVTFTSIDEENWLQISGDASAGSGSLYLLRWYPDLAEWRVYMEDKPMAVNSATFSGQFSGHYPFPSREESFVLYDPAAAITATASCARTSSPLTPLSVAGSSTLPAGAATATKQDTGNASLATIATQQTDGTQKTQVTSSVLPTGAATAAKQPALGTAGTPSTDVLSVQGVSSGTPIPTSTNVTPGSTVSESFSNCSTAQILLAAVAAPKVRKIYNRAGNGRLFVRYGSAPTAETDCNFAIEPGSTWEMPSLAPGVLEYAGAVYGLIPSGSSTAHGLQVT